MEIFLLILYIHVVGWIYALGCRSSLRESLRKRGNRDELNIIDRAVWMQCLILFFMWPYYIGLKDDS